MRPPSLTSCGGRLNVDVLPSVRRHCIFGEIWSLPLLIALGTMSPGGKNWERFALTTLIAGCTSCFALGVPVSEAHFQTFLSFSDPYFHPIVSAWISENTFSVKKRSVSLVTYNVVVQMGAVIGSQIFRADDAVRSRCATPTPLRYA